MRVIKSIALGLGVVGLIAALAVGCGSDDEDEDSAGTSIGAPKVKPPVANNMPSGFSASALTQEADSSPIAAIKAYLFPTNGFVGPIDRLDKVDERMVELNTRSEESEKVCVAETAKDWDMSGALPTGESFTQRFQCQENLDGGDAQQLAFGLDDEDFYLYERNGTNGILVYVKTDKEGTETEVWDIRQSSQTTVFLHILGSDADGGVEVSNSASNNASGSATDCAFRIKSNKDLIYFVGTMRLGGEDDCGEEKTLCYTADTLEEADLTDCTDASLDAFTLNAIPAAAAEAASTGVAAAVAKKITGHIDFSESVEVPDDDEE